MRNSNARVPDPSEFISCAGDKFKIIYHGRYDDSGEIVLVETDRMDIKAEINSHAYECDMQYILSKLQAGDSSVLNGGVPLYGDFTKFPRSYSEMLNLVKDGEFTFDRLPIEVRSHFDNSFSKWLASIGSPDWMDAMGMSNEKTEEVKNNES